MKILVVDDDRALREALRRTLGLAGYDVQVACNGQEAMTLATAGEPDAIILDVGLPDIDGLEVCRRLRKAQDRVPLLMLTARIAVRDRIDGLEAGADDYLIKPFDLDELIARVRALLRRGTIESGAQELSYADLVLDEGRHGVVIGDRFVELTRTEYRLLEFFMLNPDQMLSRDLIYDRVWGYDFGETSNALRVYIGYLRRKLERSGSNATIKTNRGVGYALRHE